MNDSRIGIKSSTWRNFDLLLLLAALALVVIGIVMIYSAYEATLPSESLLENSIFRQSLFALVGLLFFFGFAALDYHVLAWLYRWIYLFILVLLSVTLVLGSEVFGAQSWFVFQTFMAQPSELCKVLMIVVLARVLGRDPQRLETIVPLLFSVLLVLPPALLIYKQDDFGMAFVLLVTWLGMIFVAGVRWRHMLLLVIVGAVAAPAIWMRLESYMRDRILMFLHPSYDPSGASYNVTQALISIGSGGWWGKGLLHGTQSQLHFLRVRHTDFIFSVLAEELGFVGAMLLMSLFVILILRLIRAATVARDTEGRLIAAGVATMLLAQSFINLGMNANILPVTGLPLPLVSYGGSSLATTLFALGLAESVVMRHKSAELTLK